MSSTIAFSEKNKGWISFFDFKPGLMCKLNNRFYTIKDGQLYLHNDKDNATVNEFYGVRYASTIRTIFNAEASEDKIWKTIVLESDAPWKATLNTNYTNGEIKTSEFEKKESRYFAHTRKNEDASDLHGTAAQGIGQIVSINGSEITFTSVSEMVNIGDDLYQINNNVGERIGEIIANTGGVITIDVIINAPVFDLFCYAKKNSRIDGSEIRGYYLDVTLENNDVTNSELFAVNSNAVKSFI